MSDLESTRDAWQWIASGVLLAVAALSLPAFMSVEWAGLIGPTLSLAGGLLIGHGLFERKDALDYRREMAEHRARKEGRW